MALSQRILVLGSYHNRATSFVDLKSYQVGWVEQVDSDLYSKTCSTTHTHA